MTVVAGAAGNKVKGILQHAPSIDILGVNSYSAASSAASDVKAAGWKKPFVLTEFGPSGHWEVSKTPWGAPIEPTSLEKAASYYVTQSMLTDESKDICIGSYCFLWGQKQEKTATWYGMFLPSGEKLPQVDAMCRAWQGKWPQNRCPKIASFESNLIESVVGPSEMHEVRLVATDPEDDAIKFSWEVRAESTANGVGGDRESVPPAVPNCVVRTENGKAIIRTPAKSGDYRLFVIAKDGQGGACAENICFQVKGK